METSKPLILCSLTEILANQKAELEHLDVSSLCSRKEEQAVDLDSKLAQVVIGVRRSGKSTLCQKVLIERGVSFAYVNFDDENLAGLKAENLTDVMSAAKQSTVFLRRNGSVIWNNARDGIRTHELLETAP